MLVIVYCFFFNATDTPEIYTYLHTLSLPDALPLSDAPTSAYVFFCAAPLKLPCISDCMAGKSSEAPMPPNIAQKINTGTMLCVKVIAGAPMAYPNNPRMYARLRPNKSPILLLMSINAADTNASSAMADCTALTDVCKSSTTAEIDTFISKIGKKQV